MDAPFGDLQKALGHTFSNPGHLAEALTHASCKSDTAPSNERLEFLGDAILGQILSIYLFERFPEYEEGQLTRIKGHVVSKESLAKAGTQLGLAGVLKVGKGISNHGTLPESLIANALEAVIAALYLDAGLPRTTEFVLGLLEDEVENVLANKHSENYKALLQEHTQKTLGVVPTYSVISELGPDHGKTFEIEVMISGKAYGRGSGPNKKAAEQVAAKNSLAQLDAKEGTGEQP